MRNRWGIDVRKGYTVRYSLPRGGNAVGVVASIERTGSFARAYGPRVLFEDAGSCGIDDVSAVLETSRKSNPLSRVKPNSPSMATGRPPSKRLRKRRAKTEALPPGYYANPLTRVKVRSPSQRPSLPVVAEHGDPSPRLVKRRERTAKLKRPGAYANPSVKTFFDPVAADQMYIIVYAKMRDPWFQGKDKPQWREIARFDDLKRAREYGQAYADANQVQVKIGGNFRIK